MDPVILKRRHVTRDEGPSRKGLSGGQGGQCAEPSVRTLIVDGLVHALEVTCACGEKTTVELQTDARPRHDTPKNHE